MALWLFRRKSRRKQPHAASAASDSDVSPHPVTSRSFTAPELNAPAAPTAPTASRKPGRQQSIQKKQQRRHEPNKLHRRGRTYSFDSGLSDTLDTGNGGRSSGRHATGGNATPSPSRHANRGALPVANSKNLSTRRRDRRNYAHDNVNASQAGDGMSSGAIFDSAPTLHPNKRDGRHLLQRTKSSKRRKNAHERERAAEIKAMSQNDFYTPLRPAADPRSGDRPTRKNTTKGKGHGRGGSSSRHPSHVSLPESIDSAMSSDSEQIAYSVSPLAVLAPKPTLRYALHSNGSVPQRLPSQRRKLVKPLTEETLKAHKRVDDLADDLTASDLRELMERDKRRRERKRQRDQERAKRRIARDAEKRHSAASSSNPAEPAGSAPNLERGVLGREAVGVEADDTTSAVVTSSTRRRSARLPPSPPPEVELEHERETSPQQIYQHPNEQSHQASDSNRSSFSVIEAGTDVEMVSPEEGSAGSSGRGPSPIEMFHRTSSIPAIPSDLDLSLAEQPAEEEEEQQQSQQPQQPQQLVAASLPKRTPSKLQKKIIKMTKRLSSSSSSLRHHAEGEPVGRKTSESSSSRGPLSWGALGVIFKWGNRSKRSSGPSSFSNLSRDSIMASQAIPRMQPQLYSPSQVQLHLQNQLAQASGQSAAEGSGSHHHPFKVHSNVPKRTLSRFREDLPDFLMSPPSSRMQSPEAEPMPETHAVSDIAEQQTSQSGQDDGNGEDDADIDEPTIFTTATFDSEEQEQQQQQNLRQDKRVSQGSSSGLRATPTSWMQIDENEPSSEASPEPSPEPQQSMSLASIDSEGSWLSGGRNSRQRNRSRQMQRSMDDVSRAYPPQAQQQLQGRHRYNPSWASNETIGSAEQLKSPTTAKPTTSSSAADEEVAGMVVDDEYMSRLATRSSDHGSTLLSAFKHHSTTSEARPSSDEEDDPHWGTVRVRKISTVVPEHVATMMKSSEGLMMKNMYDGEDVGRLSPESPDSPDSLVSPTSPISQASSDFKMEEAGVQRATSVNLGRAHARQISAGSAKLLEISPRNSLDNKAQRKLI